MPRIVHIVGGRQVTASIAALVVAAAALGTGWAFSRSPEQEAPLQRVLSSLPADAGTINYTRWQDADGSVDGLDLSGRTARSVLAGIDPEMQQRLGWRGRDLDWEVYSQIRSDAVTVLALGPDLSVRRVERSFAAIGEPEGDEGHAWRVSSGSSTFSSLFQQVRVLPEQRLVLAGTDAAVLDETTSVIRGGPPSLASVRSAAGVAEHLDGADSVLMTSRAYTCAASALDDTDGAQQRQLDTALGDAPPLVAPRWAGRALTDGDPQRMSFAVAFGSDAQARRQLQARSLLVEGPFIGRSGRVQDSLVDPQVSLHSQVVDLDFTLTPESERFMTDTGPVVFAGCGTQAS